MSAYQDLQFAWRGFTTKMLSNVASPDYESVTAQGSPALITRVGSE